MTEAEPVHAGIDLQVTAEHVDRAARGRRLQRRAADGRRDGRRQVVLEHAVEIADAERAEDQNRQP